MAVVLIVDDEKTILKNMARFLCDAGYEVMTAEDCENARLALNCGSVDALCIDITLPDGDGLDLLEELRHCKPDLRAIVISSAFTPENRSRAAGLGVEDFLAKPFPLIDLRAALTKLLL